MAEAAVTTAPRHRLAAALVIVAAYAALQHWWLPADGFLSGDSGTKYLQARAVVERGPLTPWVEGPALDLDPSFRWQEPFLLIRKGHLVGVFPWLFAVLTAPFLRLFGLPGLYVLPALSMAVVFLATSAIGRALGQPAGGAWSGLIAVVATPLLVYGAELWEHAPAVALSAVAAACLMDEGPSHRRSALIAAVCLVLASAMRPEAIAIAPALLVARARTLGWRTAFRDAGPMAAGAAVASAVIVAMNAAVHGAAIPPQVSSNFEAGFSYLAMRRDALLSLVLPVEQRPLFLIGFATAMAGAVPRAERVRLLCLYTGVTLMVIAGVGVPLAHAYLTRTPWLGSFDVRSMASTWPLVLVACCYPAVRSATGGERTVAWAAILTILLVFVTLPHPGGAQWSARFFLPAAPLVAVLAVERLRDRRTRGLAAVLVAASIALQLCGVAFLRQSKRENAQITRTAASLTQPGDVIVSDVFWFPEVAATLYPSRRMLFARSPDDFAAVAAAVAERGLTGFWIATVTPMTEYVPPASFAPGAGQPFVQTRTRDAGLRSLVFYEYERK